MDPKSLWIVRTILVLAFQILCFKRLPSLWQTGTAGHPSRGNGPWLVFLEVGRPWGFWVQPWSTIHFPYSVWWPRCTFWSSGTGIGSKFLRVCKVSTMICNPGLYYKRIKYKEWQCWGKAWESSLMSDFWGQARMWGAIWRPRPPGDGAQSSSGLWIKNNGLIC